MIEILVASGAVVAGLVVFELYYRAKIVRQLLSRPEQHTLYAYSEQLQPGDFDRALGTWQDASRHGLFKENRDQITWFYEADGRLAKKVSFHLNNVGLISRRDYDVGQTPDAYRIAVLGDEQTATTTIDVSWPDHLQDALNADAELGRLTGGRTVRVFDYGWPDAGFEHFAEVFRTKIKPLEVDMVILNLVDHQFDRLRQGQPSALNGKPYQGYPIPYRVGDGAQDVAYLIGLCTQAPYCLRERHCSASRPFTFFLHPAVGDDPEKIRRLQKMVVDDWVKGVYYSDRRPLALLRLLGLAHDPLAVREVRPLSTYRPKAESDGELVAKAGQRLREIVDTHPNVLVLRNAYYGESEEKFARTAMLDAADPRFRVASMKERVWRGLDDAGIRSLYLDHDGSKWSDSGHLAYAKAVAQVVKERMQER